MKEIIQPIKIQTKQVINPVLKLTNILKIIIIITNISIKQIRIVINVDSFINFIYLVYILKLFF
jgi:hypothetical protein